MLAMALLVTSCAMVPRSATRTDNPFTIVLLPDTQYYSQKFPATYSAQTRWIRERANELNTEFVIHLGDIVETPGSETEWQVADEAHKLRDEYKRDARHTYTLSLGMLKGDVR